MTQNPPVWLLVSIPVPIIPAGISVQAEGCCLQFAGSNTNEAELVSQRLTETLRRHCHSLSVVTQMATDQVLPSTAHI